MTKLLNLLFLRNSLSTTSWKPSYSQQVYSLYICFAIRFTFILSVQIVLPWQRYLEPATPPLSSVVIKYNVMWLYPLKVADEVAVIKQISHSCWVWCHVITICDLLPASPLTFVGSWQWKSHMVIFWLRDTQPSRLPSAWILILWPRDATMTTTTRNSCKSHSTPP